MISDSDQTKSDQGLLVSGIETNEQNRNESLSMAVRAFVAAIEPTPDELAADRDLIARLMREHRVRNVPGHVT
jgi:hypothetical protein